MNEINMASLRTRPDPVPIPLPDGKIALYRFGDAENAPAKIVFLHANGFNALTYTGLLQPVSQILPVLAFDLRGHGATSLEADPRKLGGWLTYRDDIIAALNRVGENGPFIFAGHSMGAVVSLLIAAHWPQAAAGVVAFEPVLIPRHVAAARRWARGVLPSFDSPLARGADRRRRRFADLHDMFAAYKGRGAFKKWPDDMLWDYIRAGTKKIADGAVELACAPEWEAANFRVAGFSIRKTFASLSCPVRMICGSVGSSAPQPIVTGLTNSFGNVTAERRLGLSHFLPMEDPAAAIADLSAAARAVSVRR